MAVGLKWYNDLCKKDEKKQREFIKALRQTSEGRSTGVGAPVGHSAIHSMTHQSASSTGVSFDALMGGTGGVDLAKGKHGVFVIPEHIDKVMAYLLTSKVAKYMFTQLDGTGAVGKMTAYVPQAQRQAVMVTTAATGGSAERDVGGVVSGGSKNESVGMFIYFKVGNKGASGEYLHLQTAFPISDGDIGIGSHGARVQIVHQGVGGAGVGATTTHNFESLIKDTPT